MKRVQKKRKKKKTNNLKIKEIFSIVLLILLISGISFIIYKTDIFMPKIDEVTASYISFNNSDSTDMIKISNVNRKKDNFGKSELNSKYAEFTVNSKEKSDYKIVVYPYTDKIDLKCVKYYLSTNNNNKIDILENSVENGDGGRTIYQNKLRKKQEKIIIRMWIDKECKSNLNEESFEIKIKSN